MKSVILMSSHVFTADSMANQVTHDVLRGAIERQGYPCMDVYGRFLDQQGGLYTEQVVLVDIDGLSADESLFDYFDDLAEIFTQECFLYIDDEGQAFKIPVGKPFLQEYIGDVHRYIAPSIYPEGQPYTEVDGVVWVIKKEMEDTVDELTDDMQETAVDARTRHFMQRMAESAATSKVIRAGC